MKRKYYIDEDNDLEENKDTGYNPLSRERNPSSGDSLLSDVKEWLGYFPKDKLSFNENDFKMFLNDAYNIQFAEGAAKGNGRIEKALEKASETNKMYLTGGRKYLIQITADENDPLRIEELDTLQKFMERISHDAEWKYVVRNQQTDSNVKVRIAAVDLK